MVRKIIIYTILYTITTLIILSIFILSPAKREHNEIFQLIIISFISLLIIKYSKSIILIIIAPWNEVLKKIRENKYPSENYRPKVSVIIPSYNEEVGIINTIKSVAESEYKNMEIVVVNDGSTDKTDELVKKFKSKFKKEEKEIKLKYFYKKNEGKGKALNYGIKHSSGEIIITIDADCAITPTTIKNFIKPFADPNVSAAVGNVKIGNTHTTVGVVQFLEFLNSFYAKNAESVLGTIYIIGGAAAAFRKEVFDKVGLYSDTNITEDIDISVRICDAGMKIVYVDDAIVYTEGASDVSGLAKQRLRWKIGWFQTMYLHKYLIFSTKKEHNKILTWAMIPLVYFSNLQLMLEPWFVVFLYFYSFWTENFSPFLTWIGVEAVMVSIVIFIDRKNQKNIATYFLAPITWLLFYLSTYIEYRSLLFTIWHAAKKKEVKWQKWERRGCGINTLKTD